MFDPIIVVVERVHQWISVGAVGPVVGLWIGLRALELTLGPRLNSRVLAEVDRPLSRTVRTLHDRTAGLVSDMIVSVAPALGSDRPPYLTLVDEPTLAVGSQVVGYEISQLFVREALVRALPYSVATLVGVSPLGPVAASSVLWASGRSCAKALASMTTTMWLVVALWATGHWPLALGVQIAEIVLMGGLTLSIETLESRTASMSH